MKQSAVTILFLLLVFVTLAEEKVTFKASDGVMVTADLHKAHADSVPFIVLFHQAGWSRGEYLEIAPTLNRLGFNCLAVDLRSGNLVNGVRNETHQDAVSKMKETKYTDAELDLVAAVNYARAFHAKGQLLIWGSSYSASLVLRFAGEFSDQVDGVLAFSPGEYFKSMGKPADYVTQSAQKITCKTFITSARHEKKSWWSFYEVIPDDRRWYFLPEQTSGNHGSSALFIKNPDHKEYWAAVMGFLERFTD